MPGCLYKAEKFTAQAGNTSVCGLHFEHLLYLSLLSQVDKFHLVGQGPVPVGSRLMKKRGSEVLYYNGNEVYSSSNGAGLDFFLIERATQTPIGIEAKNIREWVYPWDLEVWRMLAKAATLECLPVLIARKLSYLTLKFFSEVGGLGFQSHFQYFDESVKPLFGDVIRTDGLGFADIKFDMTPPSHFAKFLSGTLPANASTQFAKFRANLSLVRRYAIDEGLAEDSLGSRMRPKLFKEFTQELGFSADESSL